MDIEILGIWEREMLGYLASDLLLDMESCSLGTGKREYLDCLELLFDETKMEICYKNASCNNNRNLSHVLEDICFTCPLPG
jgi:hypothetical protein